MNECEWCTYLFRTLLGRTHNRTHLQCLRTYLPLTPLPLTRSYQPLVEEEEEEEEEEYLRSDTLTCVSMTEYSTQALIVQAVMNIVHVLLVQALRNLVNRSGKIAQNIFDQLDRRLKSADKKEQAGVRGQGVGGQGREGAQKKKMSNKGPSDNPTHTKPSTVPV